MRPPELDDYCWLTSPIASEFLALADAWIAPGPRELAQLRRSLSPAQAALVLEQVELRRRAAVKFTHSDRLFFTRRGLEQATDEAIARMKAGRFSAGRFGAGSCFADLCCGLGGDLLALAACGPVVGVDRDPIVTHLAAANAAVLGRVDVTLRTQAVDELPLDGVAAWHLDPDRRVGAIRVAQPAGYEPGPELIERLRARCPHAALKLAPAADVPAAWREGERQWITSRGECRQQVVWLGGLADAPGRHSALAVTSVGATQLLACGLPDHPIPPASRPLRYVLDTDPAVRAARLVGLVAARWGLSALGGTNGYLTSDAPVDDPAIEVFAVQDVLPLDIRQLRGWLRQRDVGRLEIKQRLVQLVPEQLRGQLRLRGAAAATLLVTRSDRHHLAILAQRHSQPTAYNHNPFPPVG